MAEYERRHLNSKMLLLCEFPASGWINLDDLDGMVVALPDIARDDVDAILEDVYTNNVIYLVYQDTHSNPQAALVSWDRYMELLAIEKDA